MAVKELYEAFPYPRYPLWVPLKWGSGYLGSSGFAHLVAQRSVALGCYDQTKAIGKRRILIAGCGDTQPYIFHKWEPSGNRIDCVDISRRNVARAAQRLLGRRRRLRFYCRDLATFASGIPDHCYDHIEAFGVLHHLSDPAAVVQHLGRGLCAGGTMRVMVYNQPSRRFLWQIQRGFQVLGLQYKSATHRQLAKRILRCLGVLSDAFQAQLQTLNHVLARPSLFVDTFFHCREAQISIERWGEIFAAAGLEVCGVLDRYGELDHLANPLRSPPNFAELAALASSGQFSGNLELYLCKPSGADAEGKATSAGPLVMSLGQRLALWRQGPPRFWFQYRETANLTSWQRTSLWWRWLWLPESPLPDWLSGDARQRLARIGVLDDLDNDLRPLMAEQASLGSTASCQIVPTANSDHPPQSLAKLLGSATSDPARCAAAWSRFQQALTSLNRF